MSDIQETITIDEARDIYYDAVARAAAVRIAYQGVTSSVPMRAEEEMADALGDDPSETLAYLFRRGYKVGWKSEPAFTAVWGYCEAVWPDALEDS